MSLLEIQSECIRIEGLGVHSDGAEVGLLGHLGVSSGPGHSPSQASLSQTQTFQRKLTQQSA